MICTACPMCIHSIHSTVCTDHMYNTVYMHCTVCTDLMYNTEYIHCIACTDPMYDTVYTVQYCTDLMCNTVYNVSRLVILSFKIIGTNWSTFAMYWGTKLTLLLVMYPGF